GSDAECRQRGTDSQSVRFHRSLRMTRGPLPGTGPWRLRWNANHVVPSGAYPFTICTRRQEDDFVPFERERGITTDRCTPSTRLCKKTGSFEMPLLLDDTDG